MTLTASRQIYHDVPSLHALHRPAADPLVLCDQIIKKGGDCDCHARFIGWSSVRASFAIVVRVSLGCRRRRAQETPAPHDADAAIGVVDADVEIIVVLLRPPAGDDVIDVLDAQSRATRIVHLDDTRDRGPSPRLESQVPIAPHGPRRIAHVGPARIDGHVRPHAPILVRERVSPEDDGMDDDRGRTRIEGGRLAIQIHLLRSDVRLLRRSPLRRGTHPRPSRDVRIASPIPSSVEVDYPECGNHHTHRGDVVWQRIVGDEPRHVDTAIELFGGRERTGGVAFVAGGERMGGSIARR